MQVEGIFAVHNETHFLKLRFAIFVTNVTAMYQTHVLLWEVHVHVKFRSVCSDNVVPGI